MLSGKQLTVASFEHKQLGILYCIYLNYLQRVYNSEYPGKHHSVIINSQYTNYPGHSK